MKKEKKSIAKMSRPYRAISFALFLFLYFINFAIERTNNSRFGIRIVRKTKQKKFQAVKEYDFYDVTSSYAGEGDRCHGKKKRKKAFKRNKAAPASGKEESESSSPVGTNPTSSFLKVLTPPRADNFNVCSSGQYQDSSCDLFCPVDDVPGPSGVGVKNEVIMNLTEDNEWVDTGKRIEKKSALSNFLSKFKCGPKTTKARKIRV